MKAPRLALMVASASLWAGSAYAHPGYPAIIDKTLNVEVEKIDPPMGCQLCHTSDQGGTTTLTKFGTLLVSRYGLQSTPAETSGSDASLQGALMGLASEQPRLMQDLASGTDPNVDVTDDPTPMYGCSLSRRSTGDWTAIALFGGLVALAYRRRSSR